MTKTKLITQNAVIAGLAAATVCAGFAAILGLTAFLITPAMVSIAPFIAGAVIGMAACAAAGGLVGGTIGAFTNYSIYAGRRIEPSCETKKENGNTPENNREITQMQSQGGVTEPSSTYHQEKLTQSRAEQEQQQKI